LYIFYNYFRLNIAILFVETIYLLSILIKTNIYGNHIQKCQLCRYFINHVFKSVGLLTFMNHVFKSVDLLTFMNHVFKSVDLLTFMNHVFKSVDLLTFMNHVLMNCRLGNSLIIQNKSRLLTLLCPSRLRSNNFLTARCVSCAKRGVLRTASCYFSVHPLFYVFMSQLFYPAGASP